MERYPRKIKYPYSNRLMIDTILHTIGICGEPHVKVVDIIPFSYIAESNIGIYVNNNWQKLKN